MAFGDQIKLKPDSILMKYIKSVTQTTTSTADAGTNIVTVTDSEGNTNQITIKNGNKGSAGAKGADGSPGATGPTGANDSDISSSRVNHATTTSGYSASALGNTSIIQPYITCYMWKRTV